MALQKAHRGQRDEDTKVIENLENLCEENRLIVMELKDQSEVSLRELELSQSAVAALSKEARALRVASDESAIKTEMLSVALSESEVKAETLSVALSESESRVEALTASAVVSTHQSNLKRDFDDVTTRLQQFTCSFKAEKSSLEQTVNSLTFLVSALRRELQFEKNRWAIDALYDNNNMTQYRTNIDKSPPLKNKEKSENSMENKNEKLKNDIIGLETVKERTSRYLKAVQAEEKLKDEKKFEFKNPLLSSIGNQNKRKRQKHIVPSDFEYNCIENKIELNQEEQKNKEENKKVLHSDQVEPIEFEIATLTEIRSVVDFLSKDNEKDVNKDESKDESQNESVLKSMSNIRSPITQYLSDSNKISPSHPLPPPHTPSFDSFSPSLSSSIFTSPFPFPSSTKSNSSNTTSGSVPGPGPGSSLLSGDTPPSSKQFLRIKTEMRRVRTARDDATMALSNMVRWKA